jgi:hypothetical protein
VRKNQRGDIPFEPRFEIGLIFRGRVFGVLDQAHIEAHSQRCRRGWNAFVAQSTPIFMQILYLTFKHLLYLVSRRAGKKNAQIESQVGLQEWLADVDALFFKQNAQNSALQSFGKEEELFENLRRKDYGATLANLQHLGAS